MNATERYETVEIDLTDDQFLILARMAHEQDITFNQLVNNILRKWMEKENVRIPKETLST